MARRRADIAVNGLERLQQSRAGLGFAIRVKLRRREAGRWRLLYESSPQHLGVGAGAPA
jgi:hypothetical protein